MNETKKTVVILTPGFPKDEGDTTCLPFLQDYVLAFSRKYPSVNLRVVSFQYPDKRGYYVWNGIRVYNAGGMVKKGVFRIPTWIRVWRELKQIRTNEGIHIIHGFWLTECSLIGQWFSKRFQIKQVAYAVGQDVLKTNKYIKLLKFKDMRVIAISDSVASKFKALTGYKVEGVISSGVDMTKSNVTAIEKTIDIIGVGALTPLKNYSLFLDVIASLKSEFPLIKAGIIGKGEQEQLLKEKAKGSGIHHMVNFIGEVPHKEVFSYLNKSKIFLHTSSYEGQSTVMMEALALGLTVVCFDVGRIHVEGKVLVCKDKEEMIMQLRKLLLSNLEYIPAQIRTAEDMANDFMKVYKG